MNQEKQGCNICPRECNVDRKKVQNGVCGVTGTGILGARAAYINLVTPTHYALEIMEAIGMARLKGLTIPVVYNCSGYEKVETLKLLEGFVDVYLVDYKYEDSILAMSYSSAPDYPTVVKDALGEMVRQCPWQNLTKKV